MDWTHVYVVALAVVATALLALEKAQLSVVGICLIVAVALPGIVDIKVAIAGFANPALVTVAALYVVGEGFLRTGAAAVLADRILRRTGSSESLVVLLVMTMAALLSAFVNNVLVVLTFLPVITTICRETGLYPSRLLIPLSYASILGGMCTLVGTSTNLLVSGVLERRGEPGLGMFEMSPAGLILAGAGILFIALVGRRILPRIPSLAAQPGAADVRDYVTELTVGPDSPLLGMRVADIAAAHALRIAMVVRDELVVRPPITDLVVATGDILMISGRVEALAKLSDDAGSNADGDRFRPGTMSFYELALSPQSGMVGRRVRDLHLKQRHGAVVVALLRNGHHLQQRFADLPLRTGDVLLAFGDDQSRESLRRSADYHLIEGVGEQIFRREKAPVAMAVILGVIALFVSSVVHYCTAALIGALVMVVSGCLTARQANRAVNWPVLMFIAGTLALSEALVATGADVAIGRGIAHGLGGFGQYALIAAIYLATIVLTELLSNNAVAVIMTPVALATAHAAGADARMLVLAVAFGASTSFANPTGYKTNLLVLGPGGYRFVHFFRAGIGLDLLLGAIGIALLPLIY